MHLLMFWSLSILSPETVDSQLFATGKQRPISIYHKSQEVNCIKTNPKNRTVKWHHFCTNIDVFRFYFLIMSNLLCFGDWLPGHASNVTSMCIADSELLLKYKHFGNNIDGFHLTFFQKSYLFILVGSPLRTTIFFMTFGQKRLNKIIRTLYYWILSVYIKKVEIIFYSKVFHFWGPTPRWW